MKYQVVNICGGVSTTLLNTNNLDIVARMYRTAAENGKFLRIIVNGKQLKIFEADKLANGGEYARRSKHSIGCANSHKSRKKAKEAHSPGKADKIKTGACTQAESVGI